MCILLAIMAVVVSYCGYEVYKLLKGTGEI